jgi:hypothetical protein
MGVEVEVSEELEYVLGCTTPSNVSYQSVANIS